MGQILRQPRRQISGSEPMTNMLKRMVIIPNLRDEEQAEKSWQALFH